VRSAATSSVAVATGGRRSPPSQATDPSL
jgi:hypothetical protein